MNLRPHHALCIQKFSGHGYDERFTAHMTALAESLRAWPDTGIVLVRGCDDVCGGCPNSIDGQCTSLGKVSGMDEAALELMGLEYGQRLPWRSLAELARPVLLTERCLRVCGNCQWLDLCKNTEIR